MALDQSPLSGCFAPQTVSPPGSISVVVVNYNAGSLLARALASLASQARPPDEVIVVDNASSDGSLDLVPWDQYPTMRLIRMDSNAGFAAASNLAAREANSEWLAMLNCDATADPGWLAAMASAAARHPEIGIFASAQTLMDDPRKLDGAGDVMSVTGLAWRGGYGGPTTALPDEGCCFGACAAGAFVSRALFLRLGGFEESFFCYLEDLDFSYRARLVGQDCVFVPTARILHKGAACSNSRVWPLRMSARNRVLMLVRNTPLGLALAIWPLLLLGALLSVIHGARHGQAAAVLLGFMDAARNLRIALAQRRRIAPPLFPSANLLRGLSWNPLAVFTRGCKIRPQRQPVPRPQGQPLKSSATPTRVRA